MKITKLNDITPYKNQLTEILTDSVTDGASIGFILPITAQGVQHYWQQVNQQIKGEHHHFWLAIDKDNIVGTVQLSVSSKANGDHRGEVEKLMVSSDARGKGVAKALMNTLEQHALKLGLKLLVLDTREGDDASYLYRKLAFIEAGKIPSFARNNQGGLDATVYFYKLLEIKS